MPLAEPRAAGLAGPDRRDAGTAEVRLEAGGLGRLAGAFRSFDRDEPAPSGHFVALISPAECSRGLVRCRSSSVPALTAYPRRHGTSQHPRLPRRHRHRRRAGAAARPVDAHPLGNFTINHYAGDHGVADRDPPRRRHRHGRDPDVPGAPADRHRRGRRRSATTRPRPPSPGVRRPGRASLRLTVGGRGCPGTDRRGDLVPRRARRAVHDAHRVLVRGAPRRPDRGRDADRVRGRLLSGADRLARDRRVG